MHDFVGRWRIEWMETWSQDYVDLNEPGYFEFDERGLGSFVFGEFRAEMDVRVSSQEPRLEFSWLGQCRGHELCGRGICTFPTPEDGEGVFFIHCGGQSGMLLQREP